MRDFTNTPQSALIRAAALVAGPGGLLQATIEALANGGVPVETLVLLPVAGRYIAGLYGQPGDYGAAVLDAILNGDWQTMIGLPDSFAQAVALNASVRTLIAETLLGVAVGVASAEAQRLTALAVPASAILSGEQCA